MKVVDFSGVDGRTAELLQENEHLLNQIRSNHALQRVGPTACNAYLF